MIFIYFQVIVGFIEMSPLAFIFAAFPIVLLRMVRLLRVFRLAKTLPRLRAIVEALIAGFGAVGWICVLMIVIGYIQGAICLIIFRDNDPFHFGTVGRATFTIMRLSTGDGWDQVLLINMYGCEYYPAGYPILDPGLNPQAQCTDSFGLGWMAVFVFTFIVIMSAYILPTTLIGIVIISFDEASKRGELIREQMEKLETVTKEAQAAMPEFFTEHRMERLEKVFEEMDCDGELSLDMNELQPCYEYVFQHVFDVALTVNQQESLFQLMVRKRIIIASN